MQRTTTVTKIKYKVINENDEIITKEVVFDEKDHEKAIKLFKKNHYGIIIEISQKTALFVLDDEIFFEKAKEEKVIEEKVIFAK